MSTESTPECHLKACSLCPGTKMIRRQGAPSWEAPIQTLRCGCVCHGRRDTAKTGDAR
ncbi:hypothetical protein M2283_001078 [Streptomyces pseudovenezuelae]|uniref:Uncharacterized protein n=1 Tax=Streptomyces pseudovenezuelae TaxID=67350 RepID=A0ABT6LBW3_9ACTN|nr:hypothetical protein [Streptomyces pseudovenezuelae]